MKEQQPKRQEGEPGIVLPMSFAQALRQYLGQQKHDDVAPFIAGLANAPVVNVKPEEQAPPEK